MQIVREYRLSVAREFTRTPGPRYASEGLFSGEEFRQRILLPRLMSAMEANSRLIIELDGTAGYGTSFLEEAFGGLVRIEKLPYFRVLQAIKIISLEEEYLEQDILKYIEEAGNAN